jgi:subtilisin family serine protease
VDVAVLDTGINPHEDLSIYQWWSPFSDNGNDEVGHGTAVAGVIAAIDNQIGAVGVAPGVRLWNYKGSGLPPENNWTNLLSAMENILENADRISVVNISYQSVVSSPYWAIRGAVQELVSAGVVVVAAAGNHGYNTNAGPAFDLAGPDGVFGPGPDGNDTDDIMPAALPEAMAVSAMDPSSDTIWVGSNFSQIPRTNDPVNGITNHVFSPGGAVDVAAPGVSIFTTVPHVGPDGIGHDYGYGTGTSFAAPHVTGLVALYIAANGRATNAEGVYRIRQAIIDASLPQSQWNTNNTHDPDTNPEPLAIASESWVPSPFITSSNGGPGNFKVGFKAVPGYDYAVQTATNLAAPIAWANVATVSRTGFVASVTVTDTNVQSQSYYRLARSPSP